MGHLGDDGRLLGDDLRLLGDDVRVLERPGTIFLNGSSLESSNHPPEPSNEG